ncbi:MAG: Tad domain-containing protein, partial [Microthrixaceae bacterium]|nr:Tad domain-containing protein [Microthrixaceae bacterium]
MASEKVGRGDRGRRPERSQSGSALMFTLVIISVLGMIGAGLAVFGSTSLRTTRVYDEVRDARYATDAAMKEAVNWIAHDEEVAVDPDYLPGANDDCVYHSETPAGELLTVSCETEPGSGAGIPPDPGIAPPESILLLGDRHNEPGPYSYEKCESLWDSFTGWLNNDTPGQSEKAFSARKRQRSTWGGLGSCVTRDRGVGPISIEGDMHVAGRIQLNDGFSLEVAGGDGGVVKAQYGCEDSNGGSFNQGVYAPGGANISNQVQCNRTNTNREDPGMPWDGTPIFSDPGRIDDTVSPIGDIRPEFLPVGFDADGSLSEGYTLPLREGAYVFDPDANQSGSATVPKNLVPLAQASSGGVCTIPSGTPVIFLWGRYDDARSLNRYTADPACPDRTFWFAPNPGADRELLTGDDETAAFYLDFTDIAGASKCGGMESVNPFRWCLGGSSQLAASKPRVIVGWPDNWTAMPEESASGGGSGDIGYGERVGVVVDAAGAVEGNFLTYWRNQSQALQIDGAPATYEPCRWWIFTCPSFGQRSMRLAQFTPKVSGNPIAEDGLPNGRIYVDVNFAMNNASGTVPKIVVDYLDPRDDVAKTCGEFTLNLGAIESDHTPGSTVPATSTATISPAEAAVLADNCGSVDAINN